MALASKSRPPIGANRIRQGYEPDRRRRTAAARGRVCAYTYLARIEVGAAQMGLQEFCNARNPILSAYRNSRASLVAAGRRSYAPTRMPESRCRCSLTHAGASPAEDGCRSRPTGVHDMTCEGMWPNCGTIVNCADHLPTAPRRCFGCHPTCFLFGHCDNYHSVHVQLGNGQWPLACRLFWHLAPPVKGGGGHTSSAPLTGSAQVEPLERNHSRAECTQPDQQQHRIPSETDAFDDLVVTHRPVEQGDIACRPYPSHRRSE